MKLNLAHISDTHLGYKAYEALSPHGNNQREHDMVVAFRESISGINKWNPDLVIHSGDVADAPRIDHRMMLTIKKALIDLTDGGARPVVVIAGNHDAPRSRKDLCFLELFADIPGLHIVTQGYKAIDLGDVVVHAVPHDSLKAIDFDEVRPLPGRMNILTTHGVAESSELFLRAVGREFPIPAEVLLRDWDYVALGHWHKRGPVILGNEGPSVSKIWYAGATENVSFRDLRDDDGMRRGWLKVKVTAGGEPTVEEMDSNVRRMFRLPVLSGEGLDPQEITTELLKRLREADLTGSVVGQILTGVTRDTWMLCDQQMIRNAASGALHYQITRKPAASETIKSSTAVGGLGQIDAILKDIIETQIKKPYQTEVKENAAMYLTDALGTTESGAAAMQEELEIT